MLKINKQINIRDYSFILFPLSILALIIFYDTFFVDIIQDNSFVYTLAWLLVFSNMVPGIEKSNKVSKIINWILK